MKDIDFDELDRAVNSLIGDKNQPADSPTSVNNDVDNNTTVASNSIPVSTAAATQPTAPAVSAPVVPTTTSSVAEKRRGGRFMDVVHPSSDMKTADVRPRKRDEIVVEPRATQAPTAMPTPEPEPPKAWPDPIDFDNHSNATPTPEPTSATPVDVPKPTEPSPEAPKLPDVPVPTNPVSTQVETPKPAEPVVATPSKPEVADNTPISTIDANITGTLNSPFLSGTKVEKRPLGAFSADQDTSLPSDKTDDTKSAETPTESATTPEDKTLAPVGHDEVDTPLPAELQENLLSIESDTTTPDGPPSANHDDQPIVPASITQQYKAGGSSNTEKPGAIFDTKVYNKAIKGPAKKKSSWWVVLWIVLLLIVGVGAGAAVYYFVLPAL